MLADHPELQAARARSLAARRRLESVTMGFWDPVLQGSAGLADGPADAPHTTIARVVPADSFSAQAGLDAPLGAGLYGGGGLSLRRPDSDSGIDGDTQVAGGGRLRMPLLKDRGYRGLRLDEQLREREVMRAEYAGLRIAAGLTRDLVLAYVAWLRQIADTREVIRAEERAEQLLEQTSSRAELEVVPGYQVFPARFEVALRREERASAEERVRALERDILERRGVGEQPDSGRRESPREELLMRWAEALAERVKPPEPSAERICAARPEYRELESAVAVAEIEALIVAEELRGDLSLQAGLYVDNKNAGGGKNSDDFGYEVSLSYRKPLGLKGEKARLEAARAETDALLADLARTRVGIMAEAERARIAWRGACVRLGMARDAVDEARRVLAAEDERFGLGEGSSRNVLDAQKDLTSAGRRYVAVAAEVIEALVNLNHALGIPQDGETR